MDLRWNFLSKCCVSVRAEWLLCPLEQNHYPSPDKVWGRTRMFPVYFIEFRPATPWESKFFLRLKGGCEG